MTPSTLAPEAPPQASAPTQPPVPELPSRTPLRGAGRRERTGRATRRTVAASLLLHALAVMAVLMSPQRERVAQVGGDFPASDAVDFLDLDDFPTVVPDGGADVAPSAGPELASASTEIGAAAADSAAAPSAPAATRLEAAGPAFPSRIPDRIPPAAAGGGRPGAAPSAAPAGRPAGGGPAPAGGGRAGPLDPRLGDPRLVNRRALGPDVEPGTEHERYVRGLGARLAAYNDSVAEEEAHRRRSMDWTIKDKDGNPRWGVGPDGRAVIAGVKIPIPLPVGGGSRERQEESRTERAQRAEIDRQVEAGERGDHLRDRARATRERVDRERARRRAQEKETSGSTTPTEGSGTP